MPSIIRNTIIQGPALMTYNGQTFWSRGDVTLTPQFETFAVETSTFGQVDTRLKGKSYEVTFEPDGRVTSALIAVFWPWAATAIGTSVFGSADKPLVIHGRDGVKVTVVNAAVTQMPSLRVGAAVTVTGAMKFTGLLALTADPTGASSYLTVTTAAYPGDTGWAAADILTSYPSATWGDTGWRDAFLVAEPGWEVSPSMTLSPVTVDGLGVVDMRLQGMKVTARAAPVGPTAAEILSAMNATGAMGSSMGTGEELIITAGTSPKLLSVTVYNAALVDTSMIWGAANKRIANCTWEATRTVTAGVSDPLFAVALI